MTTVIWDVESNDPQLTTHGSGFLFGNASIVGMGWRLGESGVFTETHYTTDLEEMKPLLKDVDTWVCHNISYELGVADYLGIDYSKKNLFCTKVGAYLDNSNRASTSLSALGEELGVPKLNKTLGQAVWDQDRLRAPEDRLFIPKNFKDERIPIILKRMEAWAYQNMHLMAKTHPELIEEYCKRDVDITAMLHEKWLKTLDLSLYQRYSEVNRVTVAMRRKGVRIDIPLIKQYQSELTAMVEKEEAVIKHETGTFNTDLNYNSSKQLGDVFEFLGISVPLTEKGNPNIDAKFLETLGHPLAKAITKAKKYTKARDDFLGGLLELQHDGRIHGEMTLFGASLTGRFSHKNPNLSQIPRRDPVIGPMLRSVFIADEGEDWHSLDWAAQEPRLMVHYAVKCHDAKAVYMTDPRWGKSERKEFNIPMIKELQQAYIDNPALDSHTYNKELIEEQTGTSLKRDVVKTIALGKAYGMGQAKLAESLHVTLDEAKKLSYAFNKGSPYLQALTKYCQYSFKTKGQIKTLGGRTLKYDGADHKALNKLIQGSASDQLIFVLLKLYECDIICNTAIHDELNFSGSLDAALKIKKVMEEEVKLEIPVVAELKSGKSWAEAKGV